MLCNGENSILRIVGVEQLSWNGGSFAVAPREYSALAFRISGTATIGCSGSEYHVNTNDILYLPQKMPYAAVYTDTQMLVIHFVTARNDSQPELYTFQNSEQLYKMFLRAHTLWKNKEPGYSVYVMSQFYAILGKIFEKETKAQLPPHFLQAISFINSNYQNSSLCVNMICAEAGIGATAFRQLFKKHYQKTPIEYITDLRLEHARNLISGGMPIELAAAESGFNDPKYFARVVKKHLGCTPRDLKTYGK